MKTHYAKMLGTEAPQFKKTRLRAAACRRTLILISTEVFDSLHLRRNRRAASNHKAGTNNGSLLMVSSA
jgi:hypothetical protein